MILQYVVWMCWLFLLSQKVFAGRALTSQAWFARRLLLRPWSPDVGSVILHVSPGGEVVLALEPTQQKLLEKDKKAKKNKKQLQDHCNLQHF